MFAYPIVHELLAKSSSERALVGQIINDIVGKRMLYLQCLYNWRIRRTSILDSKIYMQLFDISGILMILFYIMYEKHYAD